MAHAGRVPVGSLFPAGRGVQSVYGKAQHAGSAPVAPAAPRGSQAPLRFLAMYSSRLPRAHSCCQRTNSRWSFRPACLEFFRGGRSETSTSSVQGPGLLRKPARAGALAPPRTFNVLTPDGRAASGRPLQAASVAPHANFWGAAGACVAGAKKRGCPFRFPAGPARTQWLVGLSSARSAFAFSSTEAYCPVLRRGWPPSPPRSALPPSHTVPPDDRGPSTAACS